VNVGEAKVEDVPMTDKFKFYITEASKLFGGLDLCALDILQYKGKDYILELNDSAIGLNPNYEKEDTERIRDYTLKKMNQEFCK
jgi:glutathione synthase/RimK-type ligase-like ATP-grasp enzyme